MARKTPASENSGNATGGREWPGVVRACRLSRVGGIERARRARGPRSGATCFVGNGDGILARCLGAALGWVARAGVDVRARRTGVRGRLVVLAATRIVFFGAAFFLLVGAFLLLVAARVLRVTVRFLLVERFLLVAVRFLLVERLAALRPFGFAAVLRAVERTEPLVFFRDAAAFNCFPLFGLWPRPSSRTPRNFPGPPHI